MSDNTFSKLYKTKSNADLLFITSRAKDYQSLAVDTARQELESRRLTSEELDAAKAEVEERLRAIEPANKKADEEKSKFASSAEPFLDIIDPEQIEPAPTLEISVKTITIFLCMYFGYLIYSYWGLLSMAGSGMGYWNFALSITVLPLIAVPVGTVFFWRKKRAGWMVSAAAVLQGASMGIFSIVSTVQYLLESPGDLSVHILINLVYTVSMCGGTWAICTPKIREIYRISRTTMFICLVSGFAFNFAGFLVYFVY